MIIDNNGKIIGNLRADIMRRSMESKDLLRTKGSLYVGSGANQIINTAEGDITIPKTTSLNPANANTFLIAMPSTGELNYQKLTNDMLDSNLTYNITCENAIYTDYVENAEEADYTVLNESAGKIEDRLTRAETGYYGQCSFEYPSEHTSDYKTGHVVQNFLHKQGARVTMKLSIYNCRLSRRNDVYDYITVILPPEFKPKYTTTIPVSLSTYFSFGGEVEGWDGEFHHYSGSTSRFMVTTNISFDSRGILKIGYELIKNLLSDNGEYCTAIEINAGWEDFRW